MIQISLLLMKPIDLDLHSLQRQGISGFSSTRVKAQTHKGNLQQRNRLGTVSRKTTEGAGEGGLNQF